MTESDKADQQARETDTIEPEDYWGFLARRVGLAQEVLSAGNASLLPWETHNPGDLDGNRVNVICPGADVIILANAESDAARLIVAEHNRALAQIEGGEA